jgi:membrane-bound lytic murein transglycosylase D
VHYAQCLIDTARISYSENVLPNEALGMMHHSNNPRSILNRRITMLFQYKNLQKKKTSLIAAYVACVIISSTSAYAITNNAAHGPIATQKIQTLVSQSSTPITITPEIMTEINVIRGNAEARTHMLSSLQRMQQYKNYIATQLQNKGMPQDLLALPLLESGYNMNAKSPIMLTAGIWQFIPNTAKNYNLIINDKRDDRLDTQLSTQAALNYLSALHSQFQDWQLAVIAYEYGEKQTEGFIQKIGSRDPWILARSPKAPADLKKFLAKYNASVIIMNHPELLD